MDKKLAPRISNLNYREKCQITRDKNDENKI